MIDSSHIVTLGTADSGAEFSRCMKYRYSLWRVWDAADDAFAMFIGLNPSTADHEQDDPTIRRCVSYAKSWGYGGIYMLNLFAFRATDPSDMKAAVDPVGPMNDSRLYDYHDVTGITIAAWGTHGSYQDRGDIVFRMLCNRAALYALRLTKGGHPSHPLYLPKDLGPCPIYGRRGDRMLGAPLEFEPVTAEDERE